MRTISFRAKRPIKQTWVYGFYLENEDDKPVIQTRKGDQYTIDPETLGQYTGVESDKAKKIYEGDTVRIIGGEYANGVSGVDAVGTVVFERGSFLVRDQAGVHYSFDMVPRDKIKFISSPS
jgi:uncharacterized phage protein (TIGR01671 family)